MIKKGIILTLIFCFFGVSANAQNTASIALNGDIKVSWDEGGSPLIIWISNGENILYANMITGSELSELTVNDESIADGDKILVSLSGRTSYTAELEYDAEKLTLEELKRNIAASKETEIMKLLEKYTDNINSDCIGAQLSEQETVRVEAAVLNGEFDTFSQLKSIIDAVYMTIKKDREQTADKKSGSGSSGGGAISIRTPVNETLQAVVPQPQNTYDYEQKLPNFEDMENAQWAVESVNTLYSKGVISGTGSNAFSPDKNVSRAEFVKMLVLAFDVNDETAKCSFDDVNETDWHYSYIASANEIGLVNGISQSTFGANSDISRQDAAAMIYRCCTRCRIKLKQGEAQQFKDEAEISDYAKDAVAAMSAAGIVNGFGDGKFQPNEALTRAMAAKMIAMTVYTEENQA